MDTVTTARFGDTSDGKNRVLYATPRLTRLGSLSELTKNVACTSKSAADASPGGGCHTKTS